MMSRDTMWHDLIWFDMIWDLSWSHHGWWSDGWIGWCAMTCMTWSGCWSQRGWQQRALFCIECQSSEVEHTQARSPISLNHPARNLFPDFLGVLFSSGKRGKSSFGMERPKAPVGFDQCLGSMEDDLWMVVKRQMDVSILSTTCGICEVFISYLCIYNIYVQIYTHIYIYVYNPSRLGSQKNRNGLHPSLFVSKLVGLHFRLNALKMLVFFWGGEIGENDWKHQNHREHPWNVLDLLNFC